MQVHCPHCQNPIELVDAALPEEVVCPTCGSNFRLEPGETQFQSPRDVQRRLGKFELFEAVGSGGFSTVYKARDAQLDRTVAIKIPRAGNLNGENLDRFLREARTVARLRHPAIVPIYEVGQAGSLSYLVSEFVQGLTLADLLSGRRPAPREAATLIAALADALHYAHGEGVVHRDVKPANIMLGEDGEPRLMDFGLAKRDAGEVAMTLDGQVLGTPAYMSPEQARGEGHTADGRADVYSLGVILYEMLTGELPFRGTTRMMLHQVLNDDPRRPRSLNDRVPRDLETACLRAMAKEPGRRYASAGALADDLRRFLAGEPIQARPVGAWERAWRWARRRPASAALVLMSGVAAMALAGLAVGALDYQRLQLAKAQTARALRKAEIYQYFLHIAKVHAGWRDGELGQAERLLEECPPDQRHWEWNYLTRLRRADLLTLTGDTNSVFDAAFSPDGTRIASAGEDGKVMIRDALTGEIIRTLPGTKGLYGRVAYSPDGTRIASASEDDIVTIWDPATGERSLTLRHPGGVREVAYSPDGTRVVTISAERDGSGGTVSVWDIRTGRLIRHLPGFKADAFCSASFSPDGTRIVLAHGDGLRVWDATTYKLIRPFDGPTVVGHNNGAVRVAFSPDGTKLATATFDRVVVVWDLETFEPRRLEGHTSKVQGVAFSPDGTRIASASTDGTVRVWDAAKGEQILSLKGHTKGVMSVAYSPDGSRLVTAGGDGTVRVWDANTDPEAFTIGGVYAMVALSPLGSQFASVTRDGSVKTFDVTTGQILRTLAGFTNTHSGVAYSPDGTLLAAGGQGGAVKLWEVEGGREVFPPLEPPSGLVSGVTSRPGDPPEVRGVVFDADGKRLAAVYSDQSVTVWDTITRRVLFNGPGERPRVQSGEPFGVAFSPDGRWLAAGSDSGVVRVWSASTGKAAFTLTGHTSEVRGLAFHPDPERPQLASASEDRTVKVWDLTTGRERQTLRGHSSHVRSVVFSSDGRRLISASTDNTARLWDLATGLEVLTLRGHLGSVWGVAISLDHHRIATASLDSTVKIWDARPWTEDSSEEREALGQLAFLFARPLSKADVIEYLRGSTTIRPGAQRMALALVDRYQEETDAGSYHRASWAVARQRYLNSFQYRSALIQARHACSLAPDRAGYRTALGAAQYRVGQGQEALETLRQANRDEKLGLANLAFQAMVQHRLGLTEEAQATVVRLREMMWQSPGAVDSEARALVREAEALMKTRDEGPE